VKPAKTKLLASNPGMKLKTNHPRMSKYSVKFQKCNPAITQIDIQGILGDGRLSLQALDFMPDKAKVVALYLFLILFYLLLSVSHMYV
jgi:hypothetical protein